MTHPLPERGGALTRCAVLGSPIAHSLSPVMHHAAYASLGLVDWDYQAYQVDDQELAGFVAGCDATWRGLSLTMPLKFAAMSLGEVDEVAALAGAANTLIFESRGRRVYNTDVGGLVWALQFAGDRPGLDKIETATVLGAGATSRSALVSLGELGARRIAIVARTPAKAERLRGLAAALQIELTIQPWGTDLPKADVLLSTVTAGGADAVADEAAASADVIFDAIYEGWPTALATAADRAGKRVVNGLDLLAGQGAVQVHLMTGQQVDPRLLLDAAHHALTPSPEAF
ncbi:shikimate dehydrogenase [Microlunatus sp. GCM10028923]|uniref:shikimate dehydrogenase n=1 Tax=Microlunatus sp. GCM10028923 TaxID=3273400 RepID=UPI00360A9C1F